MDRSGYIGGSDAGALLGSNKYKTVLDVWERLRGHEQPEFSSQHIDRGNALEPIIEEWIRENMEPDLNSEEMYERYDAGDETDQIFLQHPEDPRLAGHPDGIGPGDPFSTGNVIWEIKAPTSYSVDKIRKYGLPERYKAQVQWYMHIGERVGSINRAVIVVWDSDEWGNPIQISIPRDPELGKKLESLGKNLLFAVEVGQKPAAATYDERERETVGDEDMNRMLQEYREVKDIERRLKEERKRLKSKIITRADGAEVVQTDSSLARIEYDWGRYDATRLSVTER
jgi:YqaJ-like viral recombinase domain.